MDKVKRFGKLLCLWVTSLLVNAVLFAPNAYAALPTTITVGQTPPPASAPNVIITSIVGSSTANYIELYNQGDNAINLHGWGVTVTIHDDATAGCADTNATIALPDAWLLSKKYVTLENTSSPQSGSLTVPFFMDAAALTGCTNPKLATLTITDQSGETEQLVSIPAAEWSATALLVAQHKQRNNSPSSTRNISSVFDTDYKFATGSIALNSDPLYTPPADASGMQILEILPHSRSCAPTEADATCNDYVKLYNPATQSIDLAEYRLRIGSKGQSQSITNTFTWNQAIDPSRDELLLPPGQYFMLTLRNDGQPLSITDSGNFVWLEDAYGTTVYDPVVQYPDASSATKVGQAWAFDGTTWRWTTAPQPLAANYFPPAVAQDGGANTPTILKPCASNQYRNPATNRCKSIVVASNSLVPCGVGQERNPETNRCRSVVATNTTLTPCQPGWERNPETNRCRKAVTALAGAATTDIKDVAAPSADTTGWFVALLVIVLALAYAVYEWRQDILLLRRKVTARLLRALREKKLAT